MNGKEDVVYILKGMLLRCKKEGKPATCNRVDELGAH